MVEEDRVRVASVRSPKQDHICVFNFRIRACSSPCSEYRRQTGDAGGVSSTITAINVVGTHDAANEFLRRIVQFVGGLGATEHAEVPGIIFIDGLAERGRNPVHGFIPGSRTVCTVLTDQGLSQAAFQRFRHYRLQNGCQENRSTSDPGRWTNPEPIKVAYEPAALPVAPTKPKYPTRNYRSFLQNP